MFSLFQSKEEEGKFTICDFRKCLVFVFGIQLLSAVNDDDICIKQNDMKNLILLPILLLIVNTTFSQDILNIQSEKVELSIDNSQEDSTPKNNQEVEEVQESTDLINSYVQTKRKKERKKISLFTGLKQKLTLKKQSHTNKKTVKNKKSRNIKRALLGGFIGALLMALLYYIIGVVLGAILLVGIIYLGYYLGWFELF